MHTKHTIIIAALIVFFTAVVQTFAQDANLWFSDVTRQAQESRIQPVTQLPPDQKSTLNSILEKPGKPMVELGGTVYLLSHSVTSANIQTKFGLTESAAAKLSTIARSKMSGRGGVFLVGAGAALTLIQVFDDGSSVVLYQQRPWWREYRWLIAIAVGLGAVFIFIRLQKTGTIFKSQ